MPSEKKSELQIAMERLSLRLNILDIKLNASPPVWPKRDEWRALKYLAQKASDLYEEQEGTLF